MYMYIVYMCNAQYCYSLSAVIICLHISIMLNLIVIHVYLSVCGFKVGTWESQILLIMVIQNYIQMYNLRHIHTYKHNHTHTYTHTHTPLLTHFALHIALHKLMFNCWLCQPFLSSTCMHIYTCVYNFIPEELIVNLSSFHPLPCLLLLKVY